MSEIKHVPRWLCQPVTIAAFSELNAPSTFFQNNEIWDWHLRFLSVVGTAVLDGVGNYTNLLGGVARRLKFNVGISQMGDVNLVSSNGHAMLGPDRSYIVHSNDLNCGALFKFERDKRVVLPPDIGLVAEVQNNGPANIDHLGLLVTGYEQPDDKSFRDPVHFGAHAPVELPPGAGFTLDHPDLFNDGEHDAVLQQMILNDFQINEDSLQFDTYDRIFWRVNPSGGTLWMPAPQLIPVGCIAPFNRALFDANDEGPRAWAIEDGTVLKPRQRLSVDVQNHSASDQNLHLCLFGYLEVP